MKTFVKVIKIIAIIAGILAIMPVKYNVVFESIEHGRTHYTTFITKEMVDSIINITFNLFHPVFGGILLGGGILWIIIYNISKDLKKS